MLELDLTDYLELAGLICSLVLFAGLYQKAKDRRSRQYKGIIKFVERQESLRKAIGESSKLLRKYRKDKTDKESKKYWYEGDISGGCRKQ